LKIEAGTTLGDIQRMLAVADDPHIALVNGQRSTSSATLGDGDTLVIMPFISGG
jgi:sulfur carrier protein ThiS